MSGVVDGAAQDGWDWFTAPAAPPDRARDMDAERRLQRDAARILASPEGERLFAQLDQMTRRRVLGPEASDAQLRQLEGQRQLVAWLEAQALRGSGLPGPRPQAPRFPLTDEGETS